MFDQAFLFGVSVEADDHAEAAGDRGSGSSVCFHVAGERFDVCAANLEQAHPGGGDPRRVQAKIQGVGLAGETGVAGLEPREGEGFRVGEQIIITGADQHPSRSGHDRTSKR